MEQNNRMVVIEKGDREGAIAFLRGLAEWTSFADHPKCMGCMDDDLVTSDLELVIRNPGSMLHNFATGHFSKHEAVALARKLNTITSHTDCGAAALTHGLIANDPEVRQRFIDAQIFTDGELKALMMQHPDELGKAFARKMAELAERNYRHLEVDRVVSHGHAKHSAAVAIVDLADLFHGKKTDRAGAYVIHNSSHLIPEHQVDEMKEPVQYALLAEKIAHGGHSHVPQDALFTILVVHGERERFLAQDVVEEIKRRMNSVTQVMLISSQDILQR